MRTLAAKAGLYTLGILLACAAVYEFRSTLSHLYHAGSAYNAVKDNCRALSNSYLSEYNEVKKYLVTWNSSPCIPTYMIGHFKPLITKAEAYLSSGCEKVLGSLVPKVITTIC